MIQKSNKESSSARTHPSCVHTKTLVTVNNRWIKELPSYFSRAGLTTLVFDRSREHPWQLRINNAESFCALAGTSSPRRIITTGVGPPGNGDAQRELVVRMYVEAKLGSGALRRFIRLRRGVRLALERRK